jgi:Effector Associated Constant Component 1
MTNGSVHLLLNVDADSQIDDEERAEIAQRLRKELLDLDVHSVDMVRAGEAPEGAKGDPVTLGTLLVTLAASGGALTSLISTVQSWLTRHERSSVTLKLGDDTLAITGVSSEQQDRLIDSFVSRHMCR